MFGRFAHLTRLVALVAALVYALQPALAIAQCGCGDCACPATDEGVSCCCSQPAAERGCCGEEPAHHAPAGCSACGRPAAEMPLSPHHLSSGCSCEPEHVGQAPSHEVKRSESVDHAASAATATAGQAANARPTSDHLLSVAEVDPAAHLPSLHLLLCVWRN